ncbi:MAG: hypothetical protein ACK5MA_07175 [Parachlamydiaceae bacterium]
MALFVFTLGIYHLHVRRMANNEWKKILCNRVNNESENARGNLAVLLEEARTARRDQAREITRLEADLQRHVQEGVENAKEITDLRSQLEEKDSRIASEERANEVLAQGFLDRIKELEAKIQKLEQLPDELAGD